MLTLAGSSPATVTPPGNHSKRPMSRDPGCENETFGCTLAALRCGRKCWIALLPRRKGLAADADEIRNAIVCARESPVLGLQPAISSNPFPHQHNGLGASRYLRAARGVPKVLTKRLRFDVEFAQQLLISIVDVRRCCDQLPHARTGFIQTVIDFRFQIEEHGLLFEKCALAHASALRRDPRKKVSP